MNRRCQISLFVYFLSSRGISNKIYLETLKQSTVIYRLHDQKAYQDVTPFATALLQHQKERTIYKAVVQ